MDRKEIIAQRIRDLINQLASSNDPYGDWKNLKQLDTNEYTEEEMAEYRQGREAIREEIRRLEEELKQED